MAEFRWLSTMVLASHVGRRRCRDRGRRADGRLSLAGCQAGWDGVVEELCGDGPLVSRLREMGVVPGSRIRVLRTGNPIVFQVAGGRYCIRKRDARCLLISTR